MIEEPHPCLSCGACCATYRVSFYWAEAQERGLPETLVEPLQRWYACLRGTNDLVPRCAALEGTVGTAVACSVYEARPEPCRELQAGDDKCQRARARHGLAPVVVPDASN